VFEKVLIRVFPGAPDERRKSHDQTTDESFHRTPALPEATQFRAVMMECQSQSLCLHSTLGVDICAGSARFDQQKQRQQQDRYRWQTAVGHRLTEHDHSPHQRASLQRQQFLRPTLC
jgi:hypothetical protein